MWLWKEGRRNLWGENWSFVLAGVTQLLLEVGRMLTSCSGSFAVGLVFLETEDVLGMAWRWHASFLCWYDICVSD